MKNLCEISSLGHLKEKQLAQNETQLQQSRQPSWFSSRQPL